MSMSAAISNFMRWSERRSRHERLHGNDDTTVNVEEDHHGHHRNHDLYLSSSSSSSSLPDGRGDASSSARAAGAGAGVARRVGSLQNNNNDTNAQQEGMNRPTTAGGVSTGGDNGATMSSDQNTVNVVQEENNNNPDHRDEEEEGGEGGDATASATTTAAATESNDDNSGTNTTETNGNSRRLERLLNHQRLLELEEERELTRRRTSTCILIAVFVLFRLWIEALIDGDPGLLILCLVGTTWTARWIRTNREREEELDRRIEEFVRTQGGAGAGSGGSEEALGGENRERYMLGTDGGRSDLTLMSFQAQLALAIIESQRQMMVNGGFGHPDGHGNARERGVSEEARDRWTRYEYHDASSSLSSSSLMAKQHGDSGGDRGHGSLNRGSLTRRRDGYGSVASTDLVVDTEDKQHLSTDMDDEEQGGIVRPDSILPSSPHEEDPRSSDVVVKIGVEDEKDHHDDLSHGAPACSICLGEYEEGEPLVQLPCGHVYHDECVTAWTSNHIRCPLCNFDLENGEVPTNNTMATAASVSGTTVRGDSIV